MARWADSHNHLHDPRLGAAEPLVARMREVGVAAIVTNATCEADWPAVAALAAGHPDLIRPAFGIHPWKSDTATPGWADRLEETLRRDPTASIGECGLDGWVGEPSFAVQIPVFQEHLRIAREFSRPVTIHCLKAWEPLFETFRHHAPPERFLMHSFGGSIEVARRLERFGACFSISGYFLHPLKSRSLEVFRDLPRDRILLETDAPDMLPPADCLTHPAGHGVNHPANIDAIGRAVAGAFAMDADEFAELTLANHRRFFSP